MSDAAFLARFRPGHPEWQERPGATDVLGMLEIARALGLAGTVEIFRDYDRVLQEHRAGGSILACTERAPEQLEPALASRRFVMLVVEMDAEGFTLWCPYPSGQSDVLPRAGRAWWDKWLALGIVLHRPPPER